MALAVLWARALTLELSSGVSCKQGYCSHSGLGLSGFRFTLCYGESYLYLDQSIFREPLGLSSWEFSKFFFGQSSSPFRVMLDSSLLE